jgi:hypothetical protein
LLSLSTVIQLLCSPCAICGRHSATETSLPSDMYYDIPWLCYIFIIATVAGTVDPLQAAVARDSPSPQNSRNCCCCCNPQESCYPQQELCFSLLILSIFNEKLSIP